MPRPPGPSLPLALSVAPAVALSAALAVALSTATAACSSRGEDAGRTVADGYNEPGLRLAMCGTVASFTPPSPGKDGSLALAAGRWSVAATTRVEGEALLAGGASVCLFATLDSDHRIERAEVRTPLHDPWATLPP
jgi:hypothetical protein